MVAERKEKFAAGAFHAISAEADEFKLRIARAQRSQQIRSVNVTAWFTNAEKNPHTNIHVGGDQDGKNPDLPSSIHGKLGNVPSCGDFAFFANEMQGQTAIPSSCAQLSEVGGMPVDKPGICDGSATLR